MAGVGIWTDEFFVKHFSFCIFVACRIHHMLMSEHCRFCLPAYGQIDRRGRRFLLLFTIPCLALTLLIVGLVYKSSKDYSHRMKIMVPFVIIFGIFYSPGLGPVPFTYSAEVFPLVNRGKFDMTLPGFSC